MTRLAHLPHRAKTTKTSPKYPTVLAAAAAAALLAACGGTVAGQLHEDTDNGTWGIAGSPTTQPELAGGAVAPFEAGGSPGVGGIRNGAGGAGGAPQTAGGIGIPFERGGSTAAGGGSAVGGSAGVRQVTTRGSAGAAGGSGGTAPSPFLQDAGPRIGEAGGSAGKQQVATGGSAGAAGGPDSGLGGAPQMAGGLAEPFEAGGSAGTQQIATGGSAGVAGGPGGGAPVQFVQDAGATVGADGG